MASKAEIDVFTSALNKSRNIEAVKSQKVLNLHQRKGGIISEVVDGDTVRLQNGKTIRFQGVDTYETDHRNKAYPEIDYQTALRLDKQKKRLAIRTGRNWMSITDDEIYAEGARQKEDLKARLGITEAQTTSPIDYLLSGQQSKNREVGQVFLPGSETSLNQEVNNSNENTQFNSIYNAEQFSNVLGNYQERKRLETEQRNEKAIFSDAAIETNLAATLANPIIGALETGSDLVGTVLSAGANIDDFLFKDAEVNGPAWQVRDAFERITYAPNELYKLTSDGTGILDDLRNLGTKIQNDNDGLYNRGDANRFTGELSDAIDNSEGVIGTGVAITDAILSNTSGALEGFVVNLPFMLAQLNPITAAGTFIGNTAEYADSALKTFEKDNERKASAAEKATMLALSSLGAAVDYAGAKYVLGGKVNVLGAKASKAITDYAVKHLPKGKLGALLKAANIGLTPVKGGVVEFGQEALTEVTGKLAEKATFDTNKLTDKDKKEIKLAGALGAATGGVGKVSSTVARSAGFIAEGANNLKSKRTNKINKDVATVSEESLTNLDKVKFVNTITSTDGKEQQVDLGDNYNPRTTLKNLVNTPLPDTAEGKIERAQEIGVHLSNLHKQFSALTTEDQRRPENQALAEDIVNAVAELNSLKKINATEALQTAANDSASTTEVKAANEIVYGSIKTGGGLDSKQMQEFLDADNTILTDTQTTTVKNAINVAKAKEKITQPNKDSAKVHNDIVNGGVDEDTGQVFIGGEQYIESILSSLDQNDVTSAKQTLGGTANNKGIKNTGLKGFAKRQRNKANELIKNSSKHSADFINTVIAEADYLDQLVKQAEYAITNPDKATLSTTEISQEVIDSKSATAQFTSTQQELKAATAANKEATTNESALEEDKTTTAERLTAAKIAFNTAKENKIKADKAVAKINKAKKDKAELPKKQAEAERKLKQTSTRLDEVKQSENKTEIVKAREAKRAAIIASRKLGNKETVDVKNKTPEQLATKLKSIVTKANKIKAEIAYREANKGNVVNYKDIDLATLKRALINQRTEYGTTQQALNVITARNERKGKTDKSVAKIDKAIQIDHYAGNTTNINPTTNKGFIAIKLADLFRKGGKKISGLLLGNALTTEDAFMEELVKVLNENNDLTTEEKNDVRMQAAHVYSNYTKFKLSLNKVPREIRDGLSSIWNKTGHRNNSILFLENQEDNTLAFPDHIAALMSAAASSWMREEGNKTLVNYNKDINGLLGRKDDDYVSIKEQNTFKYAGKLRNTVADSIGRRVLDATGLTITSDQSASTRDKMVRALGLEALRVLERQGVISLGSMPTKEFNLFYKDGVLEDAKSDVVFVRLRHQTEMEDGVERLVPHERIKENYAPYDAIPKLTEILYGMESFITAPYTKSVKDIQTRTSDGFGTVPLEQQDVLRKEQDKPFELAVDNIESLLAYGTDFVRELMGYKDVVNAHEQNKTSYESINRDINNDIAALTEAKDTFGLNKLYFKFEVWANSRMGIVSNTLNPQASKLHRFFVQPSDQLSKNIDPKINNNKLIEFKRAVALAFGASDKGMNKDVMEYFDNLYAHPALKRALAARKAGPRNAKIILNAFKELDEADLGEVNAHAFAALLDLRNYADAIKSKSTFDSWIGIETDGVTNGSAIGMIMLPVLKDVVAWLERMGMYTPDSKYGSYGEWYNQTDKDGNRTSLDSYEFLMQSVLSKLFANEDKDTVKALQDLLGDFGEADNNGVVNIIKKAGRDFAKNPFMIFNYGSSIKTIREDLANAVVDNLYIKLEKINSLDKARDKKQAIADINNVLRVLLKDAKDKTKIKAVTHKDLLTYSVENIRYVITNAVDNTLGAAFEESLEENLGEFTKLRDTVNRAFQMQWKIFDIKYQKAVKEIEAKNRKEGKPYPVTKIQVKEIVDSLQKLIPGFKGPMALQDTDKVTVMKEEKTFNDNNLVEVLYAEGSRTLKNKQGKPVTSATSRTAEKVFVDGGVSGMVKMIHTIDASTMTRVLNKYGVLNIHDAVLTNAEKSAEIAQAYNKELTNIAHNYDILLDVIAGIDFNILDKNEKQTLAKYAQENFIIYEQIGVNSFGILEFKKTPIAPSQVLKDLQSLQRETAAKRKAITSNGFVMDQMPSTSQESPYKVSGIAVDNLTDVKEAVNITATPTTEVVEEISIKEITEDQKEFLDFTNDIERLEYALNVQERLGDTAMIAAIKERMNELSFKGPTDVANVNEISTTQQKGIKEKNTLSNKVLNNLRKKYAKANKIYVDSINSFNEFRTRSMDVSGFAGGINNDADRKADLRSAEEALAVANRLKPGLTAIRIAVGTNNADLTGILERVNINTLTKDEIAAVDSLVLQEEFDVEAKLKERNKNNLDSISTLSEEEAQKELDGMINTWNKRYVDNFEFVAQGSLVDAINTHIKIWGLSLPESITSDQTKLDAFNAAQNLYTSVVIDAQAELEKLENTSGIHTIDGVIYKTLQNEKYRAEYIKDWITVKDNVQGSSAKAIDIENFKAETTTSVTSENVKAIYDRVSSFGSTVGISDTHKEQLAKVIDTIITKGIKPLNEIMLRIKKDEEGVFGASVGNRIYMNTKPTSKSNVAQGTEEVFAHEFIHAVLTDAINNNPFVMDKINKLFKIARDQVTPEDFLRRDAEGNIVYINSETEELAAAQEMYDYIFANREVTIGPDGNPVNNALHEFIAYGLTNEQLVRRLGEISVRDPKTKQENRLIDRLYRWFGKLIDWITHGEHTLSADNIADEIFNTAKTLTTAEITNREKGLNLIARGFGAVHQPLDRAVKVAADTAGKVLSPTAKRVAPALKKAGQVAADIINEEVAGNVDAENFVKAVATTANSIKGISGNFPEYFALLGRSKESNDSKRKQTKQDTTNQVRNGFKTKLSMEDSTSLTKAMLMTGSKTIMDDYSVQEFADLLKDPGAVNTKIRELTNQLKKVGKPSIEYLIQIKNLGMFMATGKSEIALAQLNAENIAKASYLGSDIKATPETIILIDKLATYYAILNTSSDMRNRAAATIEREYTADSKQNGITTLMEIDQANNTLADIHTFAGNQRLKIKGYTADILDPGVKLSVASIDAEQDMKDQGYERISKLPEDPTSPADTSDRWLYVSKFNETTQFLSATVSITDTHNKGTLLIDTLDGVTKAEGYEYQQQLHKRMTNLARRRANGEKVNDKTSLIPINDHNGFATNYRYTMSEATKIEHLNKDYDVANVLGTGRANITSKVNGPKINKMVVDLTYADYKQNYAKEPDAFILVNGRSGNYYEEISKMLPNDMKQEILNSFGNQGMYIRKELADVIFGYRKFSLADMDMFTNPKEKRYSKIFDDTKQIKRNVNKNTIRKMVKIAESIWQSIIAQEKVNIVIKTPVVLKDNVISNTIFLLTKGIPIRDVIKNTRVSIIELNRYQKDFTELTELNNRLRGNPALQQDKKFMAQKIYLQTEIANNKVKGLIDEGIFQTIVEDVKISKYDNSNRLVSWVNEKTPKVIKKLAPTKALKLAYITEDTQLFKLMHKATAYSDFTARYVMYQHEMAKPKANRNKVLTQITDSFINYENPDTRAVQYMNDMGLFMFTKFFFRIQRVIFDQLKNNTAATIMGMGIQTATWDASDIMDSGILDTDVTDRIYLDPLKHVGTAIDLKGLELLGIN